METHYSEVKSFFENTNLYLKNYPGIAYRRKIVLDLFSGVEGLQILDIGCGNGAISIPLLSKNEVTFIDLSENMVDEVQKNIQLSPQKEYSKRATLHVGNFMELEIGQRFDLIIFLGVISHLSATLPDVLIRLKSLLNTNGKLIFEYTNSDHWITQIEYRARKANYRLNKINPGYFAEACKQAGLISSYSFRYGYPLPGMGRLPDNILYSYIFHLNNRRGMNFLKANRIEVLEKS